jgi:hypothetical protein
MLKPTVCDKSLCLFSYNQYGLGADLASEIRNAGNIVDILISFTVAAAMGDVRYICKLLILQKIDDLHHFLMVLKLKFKKTEK